MSTPFNPVSEGAKTASGSGDSGEKGDSLTATFDFNSVSTKANSASDIENLLGAIQAGGEEAREISGAATAEATTGKDPMALNFRTKARYQHRRYGIGLGGTEWGDDPSPNINFFNSSGVKRIGSNLATCSRISSDSIRRLS